MHLLSLLRPIALCCATLACGAAAAAEPAPGANPVLRDRFTADPAPLVVGDTVYLHVGRDEAQGDDFFLMKEWLAYSSKDLRHWTAHGAFMKPTDFKWAVGDAWAAQVVQRNGRFYFYATVQHDATQPGKAIGVAVSDNPLGPFKDARGSALVTDATTPGPYGWDDIDPTVFVDDDGTAWLAWGNPVLYLARLKANMTELDGPIEKIALPNYTEGPWLSKRRGMYYLTYASMAHQKVWEHLSYATAPSPRGPWTYQGVLTGPTRNSYTIHAGVIDDFKGQSYLAYHSGGLTLPDGQTGAGNRRAVTLEYLYYDADGRMWPVRQTEAGISTPPQPPAGKVPPLPDPGRSDPRVAVEQFAQGYPETWPGRPALASVTRPFEQAPEPVGFKRDGGGTSGLVQTFVPRADIALGRLSLYAGDGHGTDAMHPLRLSLRDVEAGTELLGAGQGLAIAYRPQGAGLLSFDFSAHPSIVLQAGRRYALALQAQKGALTINLRASRSDVYADGEASLDDGPLTDPQGRRVDFAFALYARPEAVPAQEAAPVAPAAPAAAAAAVAPEAQAALARNPLVWADVPDIAIIRVGKTYYMSSTTMHMSPGLPIMQSTDLVNWRMASYAYDTLGDTDALRLANGKNAYGEGSWASSLRHHDGVFHASTFAANTGRTHIYTTRDPERGPWKETSFEPLLGDHSLFFDDDGRVYMVHGGGRILLTEMKPDLSGIKPGGVNTVIVDNVNALFGADQGGLKGEGSQLFKVNGRYYLFNIASPGSRWARTVIVHRADAIDGPYEGRIALDDRGIAQGGLVDTPEGKWYAYLFKDNGAVGRIPYLVPVTWQDGWPVLGKDGQVPMTLGIPAGTQGVSGASGIVASDEFDRRPGDPALPLAWQWNHNPEPRDWSLTQRPGHLSLSTSRIVPTLLEARNTLTQRSFGPRSWATTRIDVSGMKDGDWAGLAAFQRQYGFVGVTISGGARSLVMVSADSDKPEEVASIPLAGTTVHLRVDCQFQVAPEDARFGVDDSGGKTHGIPGAPELARFSYSLDGKSWTPIGRSSRLAYTFPHFMGYRYALFYYATKTAGGRVDFDYYRVGPLVKDGG